MDTHDNKSMWAKLISGIVAVYLLFAIGLGVYWSSEPALWDVNRTVELDAAALGEQPATGFATTVARCSPCVFVNLRPGEVAL